MERSGWESGYLFQAATNNQIEMAWTFSGDGSVGACCQIKLIDGWITPFPEESGEGGSEPEVGSLVGILLDSFSSQDQLSDLFLRKGCLLEVVKQLHYRGLGMKEVGNLRVRG